MIISFYSFKGGVGRTMALVNIGVELARVGKNVLMVDLDLEAPGLTTYMRDLTQSSTLTDRRGMIDWLIESASDDRRSDVDWRDYVSLVDTPFNTSVAVMTSGLWDSTYNTRVLNFDWKQFFARGGGEALETLRTGWNETYDFVLVDSRTGITDTAGVCTVHLPDVIVPVFTANQQSVEGVSSVIRRAQLSRMDLAHPRGKALIFPLASRFDDRTESELSREWITRFADTLGEFYDEWLPTSVTPRQALERTKLPYVSFYSFGDKLAVLRDGPTDVTSLGFAFRTAARLVEQEFRDVDQILLGKDVPTDEDSVSAYEALILEVSAAEARDIDNVLARAYFYAFHANDPAPGPPANAIDDDLRKLLIRNGILSMQKNRVVLRDRDKWLHAPMPLSESIAQHRELLEWSYGITEAVEDRLQYVLEGAELVDGIAYDSNSPELLTPYEHVLVTTSQRWSMPSSHQSVTGVILRLYVLIVLLGSIGYLIGRFASSSANQVFGGFYGSVVGAVIGAIVSGASLWWRRNQRIEVTSMPVRDPSVTIRVASVYLQRYGYMALHNPRCRRGLNPPLSNSDLAM